MFFVLSVVSPSQYNGWFKPSGKYIKCSITHDRTIYRLKELPKKVIVRNQSGGKEKPTFKLISVTPTSWDILEFNDTLKPPLYKQDVVKFSDVRSEINFLDLNIKENYAIDMDGRRFN